MKVDLTANEMKQIQNALESNKVRRWMLQKQQIKFEIGDVVVKYLKSTDYQTKKESWKAENINSDNKMAQRYVYIYEDEFGIGYLKRLKIANGKLGQELICLTDFDYETTKFEVDPEYAEHVLLDAEFDIKKIHKASLAARKVIIKMNRKIGKKLHTLKEFNAAFENMQIGDSFWTSTDYTGKYTQEFKLTGKLKVPVSTLNAGHDWGWKRLREREPTAIDDTDAIRISYTHAGNASYVEKGRTVDSMNRYVIYTTQRPVEEEKK